MKKIIIYVLISTIIIACGFKGPLYIPKQDKSQQTKITGENKL